MDSEKAGKIYRIISPIIVKNIVNSIPEAYKQQYAEFIADLQNGQLRNIYDFCNKYGNIIGIIDSAKLSQAEYVLGHLGDHDLNNCAKLILQRIEAHNAFRQTAQDPSYVEPLKPERDVEKELGERDHKHLDYAYDPNIPMQEWFNSETIKMAGAFLYQLDSAYNNRPE